MLKAARLRGETFQEIRNDGAATGQALAVLFLATLSYGIGFSIFVAFQSGDFTLQGLIIGALANMMLSLIAALLWAITTFLVGTKLFRGKVLFWDHARTLFFSATPGVLFILIAIPYWAVYASATFVLIWWIVVCGVIAVKNSMGFPGSQRDAYMRTLLTFVVGFLALIAISGFIPR